MTAVSKIVSAAAISGNVVHAVQMGRKALRERRNGRIAECMKSFQRKIRDCCCVCNSEQESLDAKDLADAQKQVDELMNMSQDPDLYKEFEEHGKFGGKTEDELKNVGMPEEGIKIYRDLEDSKMIRQAMWDAQVARNQKPESSKNQGSGDEADSFDYDNLDENPIECDRADLQELLAQVGGADEIDEILTEELEEMVNDE